MTKDIHRQYVVRAPLVGALFACAQAWTGARLAPALAVVDFDWVSYGHRYKSPVTKSIQRQYAVFSSVMLRARVSRTRVECACARAVVFLARRIFALP